MAIEFVTENHGTDNGTGTMSIASTGFGTDGWFLLMAAQSKGTGATQCTITPPASFTALSGGNLDWTNGSAGAHRTKLFAKWSSGESGTYTVTFSDVNDQGNVSIMAFRNVYRGATVDASVQALAMQENAASLSITCPSVSPSVGGMGVFGSGYANGDTSTFTAPTVKRVDSTPLDANSASASLFVGTENVGPGATGTRTITANNDGAIGSDKSGAFSLVLLSDDVTVLHAAPLVMG